MRRFLLWLRQLFCPHSHHRISDPDSFVWVDDRETTDQFCKKCGQTWLNATKREHRHALARIEMDRARLHAEAKQQEAIRRLETSFGLAPTGQDGALSLVENVHPIKKTS